eukprot:4643579-Pyramimonas_sp.AAC.1
MRRPSRSPNLKRAPWVWSHGDGRGYCTDPDKTLYKRQLTEDDYEQATDIDRSHSIHIWKTSHLFTI